MSERQKAQQNRISRAQCNRYQRQDSTGKRQPQRNQLVPQVRPVFLESPYPIERNLERHEYSGGSDEQHHQRKYLCFIARARQRLQIANDELLSGGEIVPQQIFYDIIHRPRMKYACCQAHQQQHEREERENGVGRDRKRKSVHLGMKQIFQRRYRQTVVIPCPVPTGTAQLQFRSRIGNQAGKRHVVQSYQRLAGFQQSSTAPLPSASSIGMT